MKQQDKTVIYNVIDYCNWLYDYENKGNRTDLEMFQILKELTDHFDKSTFIYSINGIRNFIYNIEFAVQKIKPDPITELKDGQDYHDLEYFYFTLRNVHLANDNAYFGGEEDIFQILFDDNETLRERILRLKKIGIVFHKNSVDLLRFSDIAETEYKIILENKKQLAGTPQPDKTKHDFPTININKYNADTVYNAFFKGIFGLCTQDCFNDWFVNGYEAEIITLLENGKLSKTTGKPTKPIAQLRKFIEKITENADYTKDAYFTKVFGIKLNNIKPAKTLNPELNKLLKSCEK